MHISTSVLYLIENFPITDVKDEICDICVLFVQPCGVCNIYWIHLVVFKLFYKMIFFNYPRPSVFEGS